MSIEEIISKRKNIQIYFSEPSTFIQELGAPILRNIFMDGFLKLLSNEKLFLDFIKSFEVFGISHYDSKTCTVFLNDGTTKKAKIIPIVYSEYIENNALDDCIIYAGISSRKVVPNTQYKRIKIFALLYLNDKEISEYQRIYNENRENLDDEELKKSVCKIYDLFYKVIDEVTEKTDDETLKHISILEEKIKKWKDSNGEKTIIDLNKGKERSKETRKN